jgi:hypothetical protein
MKKEWVKLGGLGANIGGEEWLMRKKKEDKRQVTLSLFSGILHSTQDHQRI